MSTSSLQIGLFVSLGITVVVLLAAMWLGHAARRAGEQGDVELNRSRLKLHLAGVVAFLISFLITVAFAEMLGRHYDFEPLSYYVHLPLAIGTSLGTVAPLYTGYRHYQGRQGLKAHKLAVGIWFVAVLCSLGTGGWMLAAGTLKQPPGEAQVE